MFLAFQHPEAIAGVPVLQFLRQAMSARQGVDLSVLEVRMEMLDWMKRLGIDEAFGLAPLNEGFSGGERKRNEVLQLALLSPEIAVLDETDSGLDIDALEVVANGVRAVREAAPLSRGALVTHYTRILDLLRPDGVHVLVDGRTSWTTGSGARRPTRQGGIRPVAEVTSLSLAPKGDFPLLERRIHDQSSSTSTRPLPRSTRGRCSTRWTTTTRTAMRTSIGGSTR